MRKFLFLLCLARLPAPCLTSCSDDDDHNKRLLKDEFMLLDFVNHSMEFTILNYF